MNGWQLRLALRRGRVSRIEVLLLRGGCVARIYTRDQRAQLLGSPGGGRIWPNLPALRGRLRRAGARQIVLLQPEVHDELIGRPAMLRADPGLTLAL